MTEPTKESNNVVPPEDDEDDLPISSRIAAAKDAKANGTLQAQSKNDKMEDDDDDIPLSVLAKNKSTPTKRKLIVDDDEDEPQEAKKPEEKKETPGPPKKQATGTPSKKTSTAPKKDDKKSAPTTQKKDSEKTKSSEKPKPAEKPKASEKEKAADKKDDKIKKEVSKSSTEKEGDKKETPKKSDEKPVSVKKESKLPASSNKDTKSNGSIKKESEEKDEKTKKGDEENKKEDEEPKPETPKIKPAPKKAAVAVKKETPKRKAETTPKKTPTKKKKTQSSSESESSSSSSSSSSDSSSSGSESSSSESESESDDDDVPISKLKEKAKKKMETKKKETKKKTPVKAKKEKETKSKSTPKKKPKKEKEEDEDGEENSPKKSKKKKEEDEMPEYKWWLEDPLPEGKKWKTLQHNGVLFPPPYVPHGVKILYEGEPIELSKEQEELATYYAQYIETDHVTKPQFRSNFWKEFQKVLKQSKSPASSKITDLAKCDFSPIHKHLMEQREIRKGRSKEEKQKEKDEKDKIQEKYGVAIVDGHKQKIGNFKIEPPGLFLGRGDHPKAGQLKKRIMPEDVTLNLSKEAPIPECPVPGHKWGGIEHNDEVSWLAFWKDSITGSFKYVWLAPSSRIKGEADMKKFETARKLKKHIGKIREKYTDELKDKLSAIRQRATALYVIDHLALRVGNEKDDDEADTVGCCSLRVEHVKLKEPNIIEFDFLGKDSMRYQNTVQVDETVFKNFKLFCKGKKPDEEIFDELTTTSLNNYLKNQMEGLTAKVFRTYNASVTLESELEKQPDEDMSVDEKMLFYNRANREVAILCNHQRSVSKTFGEQMGKIDEKIKELEDEKQKLKDRLKKAQKGEKIVDSDSESDSDDKDKEKKKKKLPTDPDKIKAAMTRLEKSITKWKTKKTEKDDLKEVSLTTSKINYIDPRISVAWAKKNDVPLEKIFSKTLRQKFPWAMDVGTEYKF